MWIERELLMNAMNRWNRRLLVLGVLLSFACSAEPTVPDSEDEPEKETTVHKEELPEPATLDDVTPVRETDEPEMKLTLASAGEPDEESTSGDDERTPVETTPIGPKETRQLLSRLAPISKKSSDQKTFAKRKDSLPPPRKGETVEGTFPPKSETDAERPEAIADDDELKVLRGQPKDDVKVAPHLSVTFNQPMVEVTSHRETTAGGVPVKLDPQPDGDWRWVGTKTVMFEPEIGHMPMATEYEVTVPAGAEATSGAKLDDASSWSFSTPPLRFEQKWPRSGPHSRKPLIFIGFNQKIEPKAVAEHLRIKAKGSLGSWEFERLEKKAVEEHERASAFLDQSSEGKWMAIRPKEKLPYNSTITVRLKGGAPSAEGPRKTESPQVYHFRTFGPFEVREHRCGYRKCRPRNPMTFYFTNPIDVETFDESDIRVEPEIPGMTIHKAHSYLTIRGRKEGRTKYKVTLPASARDKYGQKLEGDRTFSFRVGPARPSIARAPGAMIVLDPDSRPQMPVYTINYKSLKVKAYKVEPSDWGDYLEFRQDWRYYGKHTARPPGDLVVAKTIQVEGDHGSRVETGVDLRKALGSDGFGNVVVTVKPGRTMPGVSKPRREGAIRAWIQSTDIGLDGFVDREEFVGWATDLSSGMPMEDVKLTLGASGKTAQTGPDGTVDLPLPASRKGMKEYDYLQAEKDGSVAFLPERSYASSRYYYRRRQQNRKKYDTTSYWYEKEDPTRLKWFVFDDRKMYRPGEEVHLKGWARAVEYTELGGVGLPEDVGRIEYTVYGPQNNEIEKGTAETTKLGGFDLHFSLPDNVNLGNARVHLKAEDVDYSGKASSHRFEIQEFRKPKFEVDVSTDEGPYYAREKTTARVRASYYAGGNLPDAKVRWRVKGEPASFSPPELNDFRFGRTLPWWMHRRRSHRPEFENLTARTDGAGRHALRIGFGDVTPPSPMTVTAEATVTDVDRQQWTGSTSMVVHPSTFYVGMKTDRYFVERGEPLEVEVIASDIHGNLREGRPVKVQAARVKWEWSEGEYEEKLLDPETCAVETKATKENPVTCEFDTRHGGRYKIRATTTDDQGRHNFSEITRWVSGGNRPTARQVEEEKVMLVPDREKYRPGDTAEILVQSPIVPAEAMMTVRRNGMVERKRFRMEEPTKTLHVKVKEAYVPNFYVHVDVLGSQHRLDSKGEPDEKLPERPAYGSGQIKMQVPPRERTLSLDIEPEASEVEPGAKTSVDVTVKNADGEPARGAEVALVVVDESVLALSNYELPDPMDVFYGTLQAYVREYHLRSKIHLTAPEQLRKTRGYRRQRRNPQAPIDESEDKALERSAAAKSSSTVVRSRKKLQIAGKVGFGRGGGGEAFGALAGAEASGEMRYDFADQVVAGQLKRPTGSASNSKKIDVRTDFSPLAAFSPVVVTDKEGEGTITFDMPDSLTRYRIMAVAVHGAKDFGTAEKNVTVRLPMMVRPSAPRFLNFGDEFQFPVVLQNQSEKAQKVKLAARASNLELTDDRGISVEVPPNDRVEVQLGAKTDRPGTARVQIAAQSEAGSDAAQVDMPVWTPATSEAFATYGTIDKGAEVMTVKKPGEVWHEFGGLEVTTSSTALQALTDAFIYLYDYDYQCAEQISSRMVSVAALRDVLEAFDAEGMPSKAEVEASMARDIEELAGRQNRDGGFGVWRRGQRSWPFVSLHATHALVRAKEKGYDVPKRTMRLAKYHMRNIERYIPAFYSPWVRRFIIAYSLYVRDLMGDTDAARARQLMREAGDLDNLPFEAIGWLLNVMSGDSHSAAKVEKLRRYLANRVTETAGAAHYAARYDDSEQGYLVMHSNRRADGIILEALIEDQPKSDLIPKIARGLLAHRKKGRWSNTQENAFILLALDRYFREYEKQTPDFVARVWLGEDYAGEHAFEGRTTERHRIDVSMQQLADNQKEEGDSSKLYLQKDGKGRMYYRVGLDYAPKDLELEPADHGFVVERTYEAVDEEDDVKRRKDGTWVIEAGAKVKVKLQMVAPTRRYHVALVDPLPAGLESLNPALATTGSLPQNPETRKRSLGHFWWWNRTWYEHQNLRDERTEAFASLVWGGVHSYSYFARATTPGEFVVPPAKAEEMYHPETFGRSATHRVIVK